MAKSCEHLEGANTRGFSRAENSRCVRGVPSSGNCLGLFASANRAAMSAVAIPSTGKPATKHFHETQHPVMRAIPPAAWTWCYVHETQGMLV